MDNAIKRMAQRGFGDVKKAASPSNMVLLEKAASVCSVPLIAMELPSADRTTFTMKTITPPENTAAMPLAQVPAPPCPAK